MSDEINIKITVNGQNVSTEKAIEVCRAFLAKHDKPKRTRFIPPTIQEVEAYCAERQNYVDAQQWYDYYTGNGWKVGKNPMRDWRASVRTWERNDYGQAAKQNAIIEESNGHKPKPLTGGQARYMLIKKGVSGARDWSETECLAEYRRRCGLPANVDRDLFSNLH